jgi:hypothetical protein
MLAWVLAQSLLERFGGDRLDLDLAGFREASANPIPGVRG